MKLKSLITSMVLAGAIVSAPAFAASAKFAADWEDTTVSVKVELETGDTAATCTSDTGTGTKLDPCFTAETTLTTIDVAQQKDLLIGVSAQIGLVTLTQAKGKSDSPTVGTATAEAGVKVTLELRDQDGGVVQTAAPGPVIFASRMQELKVDVDASLQEGDYVDVLVSLKLATTAAHHFNFIGVDLDQGVYDVVAVFDLSAFADVAGEDAIAEAEVVLGPRMVTAQEVRAAKGELVPLD